MSGPDSPDCWLLLRGLAREQRHWGDFPRIFQDHSGAKTVLGLDLPGTGTEHRRASPVTIREIMEDVRRRWLEVRGVGGTKWGVIAISLGGMVAQEWARLHPGEFGELVIINSSTASGSPPWQRIRPAALWGALGALFERDPEVRERKVLRLTTRLLAEIDPVASKWAGYARERPARPGAALAQLIAAAGFSQPSTLKCPVLVIASERDGFTHPSCSRAIAGVLGADCVVHPEAGHDLPLDDPRWLSGQIVRWSDLSRSRS